MYLHNRYFKLVMFMVLRCYCRYIIFIIIQHLCIGISRSKIRLPVHKAMHKENSWTSIKSIKYIKTINKISLQYYYDIFGSSFEYGIFKGEKKLLYEPEFLISFRRHKRCILCCSICYNQSWDLYSIITANQVHVSQISFYIQQQKYIQITQCCCIKTIIYYYKFDMVCI